MERLNSRLRGYLCIFAAAFFWGSSATAAKFLFQHNVAPLLVVESRVIVAALMLSAYFSVRKRDVLKVSLEDLGGFVVLGIIGVAGANYTYYMAIQKTDVPIAILMQYTAPVLVAVYMLVTREDKISLTKTTAIILALGGCTIMLGIFNPNIHIGVVGALFGASSAFCFAFFNIFAKSAFKKYSIWTGFTYTLVAAAVFWIVLDLFVHFHISLQGPLVLVTLVSFSVLSVLIPYFFYFVGLKYLVPSTAVIVSTMEPVIAISTAFLFLGERLRLLQAAGGLLIISAVVLLEVRRE